MNLLEIKDLSISAKDGKPLFSGLSFNLAANHIVSIKGPNGSGKSTLLKSLLGTHPIDAGKITWAIDDQLIYFLPQLQNDYFHLPLVLSDIVPHIDQQSSHVRNLTQQIDFSVPWAKASGGERMKTLIARAMQESPQVLILDEPTNHLDPHSVSILAKALMDFMQEGKDCAIILVTHDEGLEDILKREYPKHSQIKLVRSE